MPPLVWSDGGMLADAERCLQPQHWQRIRRAEALSGLGRDELQRLRSPGRCRRGVRQRPQLAF